MAAIDRDSPGLAALSAYDLPCPLSYDLTCEVAPKQILALPAARRRHVRVGPQPAGQAALHPRHRRPASGWPAGRLPCSRHRSVLAGALYYRFGSFSVLSCSWSRRHRRHRRRDPAIGISVRPSALGLGSDGAGWLAGHGRLTRQRSDDLGPASGSSTAGQQAKSLYSQRTSLVVSWHVCPQYRPGTVVEPPHTGVVTWHLFDHMESRASCSKRNERHPSKIDEDGSSRSASGCSSRASGGHHPSAERGRLGVGYRGLRRGRRDYGNLAGRGLRFVHEADP
jgi:hypothetical protein